MTIKVLMIPQPQNFGKSESGIRRVIEAYWKYLPDYDIELLPTDAKRYDVKIAHAGMSDGDCDIAMLHGLYWTADYPATEWEYKANANIVNAVRNAKEATVPSAWVAEVFQRDMRFTPHIIPHGIEWQEWEHNEPNGGFVLWNKNREWDVCSPKMMGELAHSFSDIQFVSTFGVKKQPSNLSVIGLTPHADMKKLIQQCGVYLSTTKETFGLGTLEAMAAGKPILGFAHGGNIDLIEHGVNGYLAKTNDLDDLANGLAYCLRYQDTLGDNSREMAKQWGWDRAIQKVVDVIKLAVEPIEPTVNVVIPVYNKTFEQVKRAVDSCCKQTLQPDKIIIINDGSTKHNEDIERYGSEIIATTQFLYLRFANSGVANARNNGIALTNSKYICCLDADDWLEPDFLKVCVDALENDNSLGLAYTSLRFHHTNGESAVSKWPSGWDYDRQCNYDRRQNQVPTCNVFRRKIWERLGGYRQRYAPEGCGAEDAEFWTRIGAYGWKAEKVTDAALFNYSEGGEVGSNPDYREVDWLAWHPWAKDKEHPFASYATPKDGLLSHPVRQYDEPVVSVIIPVGPGHEKEVINALDSLEAQTFRKWEAIVIIDTGNDVNPNLYSMFGAYPYTRLANTTDKQYVDLQSGLSDIKGYCKSLGAGYARNRGVEIARAPLLLFLDADDTLHPEALQKMLDAWSTYRMAIYTDYVGQAYIDQKLAGELQGKNRLQSFNHKTGEAIIAYKAYDYDCKRAVQQPNPADMYIWNLITTMIPKSWHNEIGGFDESMETWEDWDYWIRMAKAGKCFYRLPEQLVRYRFHTGTRRELGVPETSEGRQMASVMIKYMSEKDTEIKMCTGCRPSNRNPQQQTVAQAAVSADNFIKCRYTGRRGNHHVTGAAVFQQQIPGRNMLRRSDGFKMKYGYISEGQVCDVHAEDVRLMPGKWEELPKVSLPAEEVKPPVEPVAIVEPEPPPVKVFSLQSLPGITPAIARRMEEAGLNTKDAILDDGVAGLTDIKGIGERKASLIIKVLSE
jgi:glycosyltransferase involved in cell wall biosynthesis